MKSKLCLLAMLCPFLSMCHSVTVRGNIINTEGAPIAGAVIRVVETGKTTVSDKNGEFIIKGTKPADSMTVFAYGYKTITEPNNKHGLISIILKREIPLVRQRPLKPLTVGDTIPYIIVTDVINFPVSEIHLSSYKGKLLIIDFWATWCNSCVRTFPKLDSLQKKFSKHLQFVLVNNLKSSGNTKEQVKSFFTTRKKLVKTLRRIPVCTDSTLQFKQLFPYTFIPHYIWIGPAGNILAITGSEAVTAANIQDAIRGKPLSLPVKRE